MILQKEAENDLGALLAVSTDEGWADLCSTRTSSLTEDVPTKYFFYHAKNRNNRQVQI